MFNFSKSIHVFTGLQSQNIIVIGGPAGKDDEVVKIKITTTEGMAAVAKVRIDIVDGKDDIVGIGMRIEIQNQVDIVEAHDQGLEVERPILHLIELDQISRNPLVMAANIVIVLRIPLQNVQ